ncbi:hypothetical protein G6F24_014955 [Rhizopus arrhizus]|nr:hypothetical protein G6F24_014955 [Rhizopus arrhizus]
MLQVAAQRHRERLARLAMAHRPAADLPCQPEMSAAIGHACGLGEDAPWLVERLVDDPQRARATHLREVEISGRMPLGHIARTVHPDEEERQAGRTAPRQRAQAMAHRLEADAELMRQQFDVVAAGLGRTQEAHVRHHQRTGEIVGKPDP